MSSMTVKTKLFLVTLLSIGMVFYLGLTSYLVEADMASEIQQTQESTKVLRRHMTGDMMHDAMRADVLQAALGLQQKDPQMIAEAKASLAEHSGEFLDNLRENLSSNVSRRIGDSLRKAEPALRAYSESASRYVEAASADLKAGTSTSAQLMPAFVQSFENLAVMQEDTTQLIETGMEQQAKAQEEKAAWANKKVMLASVLAIIFAGLVPVFSQSLLFRPLTALIETMNALTGGGRNVTVPYVGRSDEVGEMASALVVFQRNAEEKVRLEREQEEQKLVAERDRRQAVLDLADRFEIGVGELVKNVAAAATELQATSSSMRRISQVAVEQAGSVAAASEQTAHNANTVAAATEELSASFGEINQRVTNSTEIIQNAVTQTQDTAGHVKRLDDAARKIGEVVRLISDIAEQTNLLALNATIEAARAGDAGKGFAVVASEVKALANQTAKATEEVETQIRAIQAAVHESSKAMTGVTQSIDKVRDISGAIAGAIEEQNSATLSIASNVAETSRASTEIKANIDGVLHASEETGSAAGEVLAAAEELGRSGELLSQQVERFLIEVRGAK